MNKYNATISIERDVWDAFKNRCNEHGTSATAEINAFIKAFMLGEAFKEDYDELPVSVKTLHDILLGQLDRYIDDKFEDANQKMNAKLKNANDNLEGHIINWLARKGIDTDTITDTNTDVDTGIDTDTNTDTNTDVDTGIDTDTNTDVDTGIDTDTNTDERIGIAMSKQNLNQRTYNDKQVANLEGFSKESARRYRKGTRQPRDKTFWQRWALCDSNDDLWLKIT